jgi:hypothetical protein
MLLQLFWRVFAALLQELCGDFAGINAVFFATIAKQLQIVLAAIAKRSRSDCKAFAQRL